MGGASALPFLFMKNNRRFVVNPWSERTTLEPEELPRARNVDSSVSAQYEDSVSVEAEWDLEDEAS